MQASQIPSVPFFDGEHHAQFMTLAPPRNCGALFSDLRLAALRFPSHETNLQIFWQWGEQKLLKDRRLVSSLSEYTRPYAVLSRLASSLAKRLVRSFPRRTSQFIGMS